MACSNSSLTAPGTANCEVYMTGVAPSGGLGIHIVSSSASVSVPTWVVIPAGSSSAPFQGKVAAGVAGTVTLTGTFNGVTKSVQLQIGSSTGSALSWISCGTTSLIAPGTANCAVHMTAPAPSGGLGIHMSSNNGGVSVPTWVVVPAGSATGPFTANAATGVSGSVILTGSFSNVTRSVQLQISSDGSTVSIALSPTTATVQTGAQEQFRASVSGTTNTAVTWTVAGSGCSGTSCGIISSAGVYTAPSVVPSPAGVTVRATSQQDSTKSAVAAVTITAPATVSSGKTYYIAPAGAGGSDQNDGLSANAPWLTPNHSLHCGDIILAASGAYDAQNFMVGTWGTVSCPSANNVAWLKCAKFDTCRISTSSQSAGMWVDRSFWGVQGWEITTQKGGAEPTCFVVAPNWNNPIEVHHVILANNVANGCQSGGISTANHPGTRIGVDYLAIIGNIAYNSTQGSSECYTGISVYAPMPSDSNPGTHIYLAGNFAWNNFDPDYCAGGPATDGEGLMFDEVDASNQNLSNPPYSQQMVADNNLLIGNGGPGLQVDHDNAGSAPWATIYTRHNTMWGNNHDQTLKGIHGELLWGTVKNTHSSYDLAVTNLQTGGGGYPVYGYTVTDSPGNSSVGSSWAYSPWGNSGHAYNSTGFTFGPNNTFGVNPQLTNPTLPGAPNCSTSSSVRACMATVVANFAPKNLSAKAYGYQVPTSTPVQDPLFPQWLCTISNFPAGLVTMGCAP